VHSIEGIKLLIRFTLNKKYRITDYRPMLKQSFLLHYASHLCCAAAARHEDWCAARKQSIPNRLTCTVIEEND